MSMRPQASFLRPGLRAACLRLFAVLSLLFATATTQELLLLASGAECCEDDACGGSGDCAPASCQVCSCCHFSAVLGRPEALARLGFEPTATLALEPGRLESFDYRAPPFRPPGG